MKSLLKCTTLAVALLLAASAFASNKGQLQVPQTIMVQGKQLAAGDYNLKWDGNGPNVELNILSRGRVVATVPARVVDLSQASSSSSAILRKNDDGTMNLTEIRFGGKKYALALGQESASATSGPDSTK
jgi:hypothetical protein